MEKESIFLKIDFGHNSKNYFTYHLLKKSEQHGYVLGAGKPVTNKLSKALSELFSHNAEKSSKSSKIEEDIVFRRIVSMQFNNRLSHISWLVPPSKRIITIDDNGINSKKILCDIGWYFFTCEHNLYVFAIDYEKAVKSEDIASSKLYHAPLMNVNSNGLLCWGNVIVPEFEGNLSDYMIQIEQSLFNAIFNHFAGTEYKEDLELLYKTNEEIHIQQRSLVKFSLIKDLDIL